MPNPVRISVIVPVHNGERYIEAAIRSALASDLRDLEIIVVDDGSHDGTAAVVARIDDPRITFLQQPASGGPARPRNVGISHSRAPYIAFLDADDLLKPDKLSATAAALDQHPGAAFAFAEFEHIDATGKVLEPSVLDFKIAACALVSQPLDGSWRLIQRQELQRGMLQRNFIGTSGVVVRKTVLDEVGGFDEGLVYSEDLDLWFRLAHYGDALYRETVGHSYRLAPGSLTNRPTLRTARDRLTVLRRERRRRSLRKERRQLDLLIAESLATIGYEHRRNRERLPSMSAFAQALLTHPDVRWVRALVRSLVA